MTGLLTPVHLAFLAVVLFLLFGARRLPELGRAAGDMVRELRAGVAGNPPAEEIPQSAAPAISPAPAPAAGTARAPGTAVAVREPREGPPVGRSRLGQRLLLRGLIRVLPRPLAWVLRAFVR